MAAADAAPSITGGGHVAVIDIGSNSIRLVVFDERGRIIWPLYNEKVLCGLGRGLAATNRLNPEGMELARNNLARFTRLANAMGATRIDLLATAAVREAENGAAFVAEVEKLCGLPVTVLNGPEEARLSALGVAAGLPAAAGVMGDLGGGSLELVEVEGGEVGRAATLPLGPFPLMDRCGKDLAAMQARIDETLGGVDWLARSGDEPRARTFYPVGGAWRNLARIHIAQSGYPLHVIHGYTMRRAQVEDLSRVMSRLGPRSLARIQGVTRRRLETLPAAALVLSRVLRALGCKRVVFSAFGLREGHVFDLLSAAERARDPLIAIAEDVAEREARFDALGKALLAWTDPLFPGESAEDRRLRHAACLLSDIAWREHPDYRAAQALQRILYFPFIGIGHAERVFLAFTVFTRYGGAAKGREVANYLRLLAPAAMQNARVLGLAQRLAFRVSGATRAVLDRSALEYDGKTLRLILPDDGSAPTGEAVQRRFGALADALGVKRREVVG